MSERDKKIEEWNRKVTALLWTIMVSMITSTIVTMLCKG